MLLGNGDGTFGMLASIFDKGASLIVAADFNGDGKLDIAAMELGLLQQGMVLLLGNGDGTFQLATYPFSDTCGGLLTADLNLDRNVDFG